MILEMEKVRILGPRPRIHDTLLVLQDTGLLHLAHNREPGPHLEPLQLAPNQREERQSLRRALDNLQICLALLGHAYEGLAGAPMLTQPADLDRWSVLGRQLRPVVEDLRASLADLEEEQALIKKYVPFLRTFEALLRSERSWTNAAVYHLVLRREDAELIGQLQKSLEAAFGREFDLFRQDLPGEEVVLLLVVTRRVARAVERVLNEVRVEEVPVPASFGRSLADAAPVMLERLEVIPAEMAGLRAEIERLSNRYGLELQRGRAAMRDRIAELEALPFSLVTEHAFVIEGWLPAREEAKLRHRLASDFGENVIVEAMTPQAWADEDPPVLLGNSRFVRPFEAVMKLLPPPRYGSVDPTPLVALFFPLFFGLILGDVAYGVAVIALSLLAHTRSDEGSLMHSLSEVGAVCGVAAIAFGLAFGELLGDLGHREFGLQPLVLNREEALLPLLGLAIGLGFIHILLGLALGVVSARRMHDRRKARARALTVGMLLAGGVDILALLGYLPHAVLLPAAAGLVLGLPLLVHCEGFIAPVELLSTMGNVLSYARLMALGTASVMLAVVANQLSEAAGHLLLGVLVGLLFHMLNLVLGVFSPTIHSLRLHYVEFFGKFYVSGGVPYRPFTHWRPEGEATST